MRRKKDDNHNWKDCWMEDCIHLRACRRIQSIGKSLRLNVPRYCSIDCTAYDSAEEALMLEPDDAYHIALDGASSIERGYDRYDAFSPTDFLTSARTVWIIDNPTWLEGREDYYDNQ